MNGYLTRLVHGTRPSGWAIVMCFFFIAGSNAADAAERVRIATAVSWPGYSFWEIAEQKGLAPDLDLEVTILNDPVAGYGMLAAGQFDVYNSTIDYAPIASEQNLPIKQVSLASLSYGVDQVMLAPGVEPDQIRGTRIAAPEAFVGHLMVGHWLNLQGIGPDEVQWVNLNADEAAGAMLGGDLTLSYMYEPWTSNILENLPGARVISKSNLPEILETAMIGDAIYMSDSFIAERPEVAAKLMRAYWDAVQWWKDNPAEGNQIITDYLQWPLSDTEFVLGTDGTALDVEGVYPFTFGEAARLCGVLEGEGPFGLANGQIYETFAIVNARWKDLGLMRSEAAPEGGVDCSVMQALVDSGYTGAP